MTMAAVSEGAGSDLSVAGAFQGRHNAEVHPINCHSAIRVHQGQHHTLPASSVQLEEAVEQSRGQALAGCADGHHHLMQLGCVDIRVMQQGPICCLAFLQRSQTVSQTADCGWLTAGSQAWSADLGGGIVGEDVVHAAVCRALHMTAPAHSMQVAVH